MWDGTQDSNICQRKIAFCNNVLQNITTNLESCSHFTIPLNRISRFGKYRI
jgi:hypothetical protein